MKRPTRYSPHPVDRIHRPGTARDRSIDRKAIDGEGHFDYMVSGDASDNIRIGNSRRDPVIGDGSDVVAGIGRDGEAADPL